MIHSVLHSSFIGPLWIIVFTLFFLFRIARGNVSWLGVIFDLLIFGVGLAIIYPAFVPGLLVLLNSTG